MEGSKDFVLTAILELSNVIKIKKIVKIELTPLAFIGRQNSIGCFKDG